MYTDAPLFCLWDTVMKRKKMVGTVWTT